MLQVDLLKNKENKMERKINWGVLGYAGIARKHVLPAMLKTSNSVAYAIASRSDKKLKDAVSAFGFKKTYHTYDELLDDDAVQAVYIPLPNAMHKEWVIKAARKGKHVLCEKPLALHEDDVKEMMSVAKDCNVKLMEAFMYRFTPRTAKVIELLESGVIGKIGQINSNYSFYLENYDDIRMNRDLGGGSLHDVGCYPVNFISMVMNDYPVSIAAQAIEKQGVDVALSASLKYKSGVLATVNCSFLGDSVELTEITGSTGTLVIRDTFYDSDLPILLYRGEEETVYSIPSCDRYQKELEAFSDCILNDKDVPLNLDESVRNIRLIREILEKAGI